MPELPAIGELRGLPLWADHVSRLARVFWDQEAKRSLIGSFKWACREIVEPGAGAAATAGQATDPASEESRQDGTPVHGDGMDNWLQQAVRELVGEARTKATERDRTPAAAPDWDKMRADLNDFVCKEFPTPIAACYDRLENRTRDATEQFLAFLDTAESIVHFLAVLIASHRLESSGSGDSPPDLDRAIADSLFSPRASLGHLMAAVQHGMQFLATENAAFLQPDLVSALVDRSARPTEALRELSGIVAIRNRQLGHGRGRSRQRYEERLEYWQQRLWLILDALRPLARGCLVQPVDFDPAGVVVEYVEHRGAQCWRRRRPMSPSLVIRPEHLEGREAVVMPETSFLWVPDATAEPRPYLPLYPVACLAPARTGREAAHLLSAASWENGTLRRAEYDSYEVMSDSVPVVRKAASPAEHHLLLTLEARAGRAGLVDLASRSVQISLDLPRDPAEIWDIPAVRAEQAYHHRTFAGRSAWLERLGASIASPDADRPGPVPTGTYRLVLGVAGTGKSALLAELYERFRGQALLHMIKSEREPERFLRYLLAQASGLRASLGMPPLRDDVYSAGGDAGPAGLATTFWNEATQLAPRLLGGQLLVLLDGLDELPARFAADPWFLPPTLPEGVCAVLSCRPELPLTPALRSRLHGLVECVLEEGLTAADVHTTLALAFTARDLPLDWLAEVDAGQILQATGGHPLFVAFERERIVLEAVSARQEGRPASLGASEPCLDEDAWLTMAYRRACRRAPGPQDEAGRARERILHALALVHGRTYLGIDELQGMLAAGGMRLLRGEVRDHAGALGGYLLPDASGGLALFHKRWADHIAAVELGAADRQEVHRWFLDWLGKADGDLDRVARWSAYGLEHLCWHLRGAGEIEGAARLLTSFDYLEARLRAGSAATVSAIDSDYQETLRELACAAGSGPARSWRVWRVGFDVPVAELSVKVPGAPEQALMHAHGSLRAWEEFWRTQAHVLRRGDTAWPAYRILFQLTWEYAIASPITQAAEARESRGLGGAWIRRRFRPREVPRSSCLRVFDGHRYLVDTVAIHPDGRRALSGSKDLTLKLWDLETGACLTTFEGHGSWVSTVTIHPAGRRALSGSDDRTLKLWDLESAACVETFEGHRSSVSAVTIHPGGRRALSGSVDGTLKLWDLETGECLATFAGHDQRVHTVAILPDGRRALSGSKDLTLKMWDLETGECLATFETAGSSEALAIHPDGRRALSAGVTLKLWDLEAGECLTTFAAHDGLVKAVAIHPDGNRALSRSWRTLKLWDLETGECLATLDDTAGSSGALAIHPDGRRALSAGVTLKLWDLEIRPSRAPFEGHGDEVLALAIHPDGSRALSGSRDRTLRLWDLRSGACLATFAGHEDRVNAVAIHPDGRRALSGCRDGKLGLWDLEAGACLTTFEGRGRPILALAIHPDGRRALSGSADGGLELWDLETGVSLAAFESHGSSIKGLAIHPDGRRALSGSEDWTLKVWDLETKACLATFEALTSNVKLAIHPDGRRVLADTGDEELELWDLVTGECLATFQGPGEVVAALAIHPDGRWAVSVSGSTLCLWEVETGSCIGRWEGEYYIGACAVSPDGCVVAGDSRGDVVFLDVAHY